MLLRHIKLLLVLSFVFILVPGEKLSMPVGLLLVIPFLGISSSIDILLMILPLTGVLYMLFSYIINIRSKSDDTLVSISLSFFWGLLLCCTTEFIRYSNTTSLLSLLIFLCFSILFILLKIRAKQNARSQGRSIS